jgi:starch-binding outer membrane protein SusE/F
MNTMKIFRIVLSLAMMAFMFAGCEEDGDKAVLKKNVGPNELKPYGTGEIILTKATRDNLVQFEWTETDYGFNGAINYVLLADYAGNDFQDAVEVTTTYNEGVSMTVAAFNDAMLSLGLLPEEAAEVELMVVSSLNHEAAPIVFSNVITVEVTAYATVFPPIYGMGDGLKGWGPWPDNAVEWQSDPEQFNKFETVAYFTNGKFFRWFKQLGWDGVD